MLTRRRVSKFPDRVHILKCTSEHAAFLYNTRTLDFAFIDADHSYEGVMKDLSLWSAKIKEGGWIGGHDWSHHGTDDSVERAVKDFFVDKPIEVEPEANCWFVHL